MKSEDYEKKIIERLHKMPKIMDHTNKDELFKRISTKVNTDQAKQGQRKGKRRMLIPILGTAGILVTLFIMITSFTSEQLFEGKSDKGMDYSLKEESLADHEMETAEAIDTKSYVIQTVDADSRIIHAAVADQQAQYIIPLSVIIQDETNLNEAYNNLADYLKESEWGLSDYLFKDVIFDVDPANNEVVMDLPEDFTIGDGSAEANIISEVLESMFQPYLIEEIVFKSKEGIDLGPFGVITELPLSGEVKVNYKVFQASENEHKFLIPIKRSGDETIDEAFANMKIGQESLNVYQTIPDDAHFTIGTENDPLLITFSSENAFIDQQASIIMIEAILMTAKSFGYNAVQFENSGTDQIGPYDLTKSIKVPAAVNPIN